MNTEIKVKLTPKIDKAVYSQIPPMPIHLKKNLFVELALSRRYGIMTVLRYSKYAIDKNTTSYSINEIEANARIRVEQDVDLVPKNLKLNTLGQPLDDVLLTTDRRFKQYKANEDRIILKYGLLFRKYYGETGSVKYYQILISKN